MGEYLKFRGQDIKLGTCESLYYISLPQVDKYKSEIHGISQYLKPGIFRFRFPFPDEKHLMPGEDGPDHNFDRGFLMSIPKSYGIEMPHGTIFMRTDGLGKNAGGPANREKAPAIGFKCHCPQHEAFEMAKYDWSNTSEQTIFEVVAQKIVLTESGETEIQTVIRCPYCGEMCRMDKKEALALKAWADQDNEKVRIETERYLARDGGPHPYAHQIAFRNEIISIILKGYGI